VYTKGKDQHGCNYFCLKETGSITYTMIALDRETMLAAGVVICLCLVVYMYNDMKKTKEDVFAVKTFSTNLMKNLTIEPIEPEPVKKSQPPATEEKTEE
jgi:hypothetical protein